MKELDELHLPEDLGYTDDHEWARITGETVRIGVSDYAQDQLGDVIYVELPRVGERFRQGENFGIVESAKSVSTLYMPVSGEVVAINEELDSNPELINQEPYGAGWMILVKPDSQTDIKAGLLTGDAYKALLEGK